MKCIFACILCSVITASAIFAWMRCCKSCCAGSSCSLMPCSKSIKPTKLTILQFKYPFSLDALPYDYNGLEPHIDEATMRVHHTKHHQAYVDNANKALQDAPELQQYTLEELLTNLEALPASVRERIRNNAGGHFNHTLFWQLMSPQGGGNPTEAVANAITTSFSSFQAFKELFEKAAQTRFGSGWAWLCIDKDKKLVVTSTGNQDTPLADGLFPILGLDVWEHAYYLKYQNKRVDYMSAWWNVINWHKVESLYFDGLKNVGE